MATHGDDVGRLPGYTAPEQLTTDEDAAILAKMGYKQELRRNFTMLEVFGIAFSIIGLLPSIASTLSFSLPAGPAGMVWGWVLCAGFICIVGIALADLGSSMPTSGGLYWWTHYYAGERWKNPLSFLVGYSNTLGLVGGFVSIDYSFALMFLSVVVIASDGQWNPSNATVYGVFVACVLLHAILASTLSKIMGKLQTVFVVANILLIVITIIVLPAGTPDRNNGEFIFATLENGTTWPLGWTFMLSWLSAMWTIGAFDSCVHMAEEASNAARAVPIGIIAATSVAGFLGTIILIVIAACIDPNLNNVIGTVYGQPMAQIYYDAVGKQGALAMMTLMFCVQFFMGLSILVAASRQTWAFSRDGALPFSTFFRPISTRFGYIPLRTVWGCALLAIVLGLLALIDAAAASALFSLSICGGNVSWLIPIFSRVMWGRKKFVPGPIYTGDRFSVPIAIIACIYLVFGTILAMFPLGGPDPTPDVMNYAVLINVAVWGGALLYYFIDARKWFTGPKTTIEAEDPIQELVTESFVDKDAVNVGEKETEKSDGSSQ